MSTPATVKLSYNELVVQPDQPVGPFGFKVGIDNADPFSATTIWLSTITDTPETLELVTSLEIGDQVFIEQANPVGSFGNFLVTAYGGFSDGDFVTLYVVGVAGGSPLESGLPHFVTVPALSVTPPDPGPAGGTSYATVAELARILLIPNPTQAQALAMQRVLDAAATEITEYLGLPDPLEQPYPALVVEVNLERAVEHWKQEQSPFGIVVLGGELPPGHAGVNAWRRHARTLLPLKRSWGVA